MKPTIEMIKYTQQELNLAADGIAGPKTEQALLTISVIPTHWPMERKIVGYIQYRCTLQNIPVGPIDGYRGPQTDYGFDQLVNNPTPWRDDEGIGATPDPSQRWPIQTQEELTKFYGPVGTNQVSVDLPYPLKLAWDLDTTITRVTCHTLVAPTFVEILEEVRDSYGYAGINDLGLNLFGGMLNVRPMRGGTKYSTHAWGIAADFFPQENQLRWDHTKAAFARPEYNEWNAAWLSRGAISLGKSRDFDWMHYQFARVK